MDYFSSLPITVQVQILRKLGAKDQINARLVNSDWFHLISYIAEIHFPLTDQSLMDVKNSTISEYVHLGKLTVKNVQAPIPVFSSKRIGIPKANTLVLGRGISGENVMKLLRYYAASCQSVRLSPLCFAKVNYGQLKVKFQIRNIKELHIRTGMKFYLRTLLENFLYPSTVMFQTGVDICQHLKALNQLLRSCKFASLRKLHLLVENYDSLGFTVPDEFSVDVAMGQVLDSLRHFLNVHGEQLVSVHSFWFFPFASIGSLQVCTNLEELGLYIETSTPFHGPRLTRDELRLVAGCFTKLRFLRLGINQDETFAEDILRIMLQNNRRTLTHISCQDETPAFQVSLDFNAIECIRAIPVLFLTKLEVQIVRNPSFLFGFTIPTLRDLTVQLDSEEDIRNNLLTWIVEGFRNLKCLALMHYRLGIDGRMESDHISRFVAELEHLKELSFWSDNIQPISLETELWVSRISQNDPAPISGKWISGGTVQMIRSIQSALRTKRFKITVYRNVPLI